jgi:hypothetical protein
MRIRTPGICHALSQVTNHAPSKPVRTPSSGLETANQNGITSLNGSASRVGFAVCKIVFIPSAYLFDSARAIARVLDFGLPLPDPSLLPLPDENPVVAAKTLLATAGLFRVVGFTTFALSRRLELGIAVRLER